MFDAKKLLDALGAPTQTPAPAAPDPASASVPAAAKPASPFGAGTILSDLIGLASSPTPPAETLSASGETAPKPPKPTVASPADLTDLLLGKAQEYLKTPQGNAVVTAAVVGLTKIMANSETGRKLGASAMSKGTALFNRIVKKPEQGALLTEATDAQPALATSEPADAGETALLVMRAMIAAAASDGRVDDLERARILGALRSAGIEGDGARLIEHELEHPATAADLAKAAKTPEMALQAYTAARRIITPNSLEERVFLAHLSAALGLAPHVVAHIDASAAGPAQR